MKQSSPRNEITTLILSPIENYINSLPDNIKPLTEPLTQFQGISIFHADLENYIKVVMGKHGFHYNPASTFSDEMFKEILTHICGYHGGMETPKAFSQYWIEAFENSYKKERRLPVIISYLASTISKAISRFLANYKKINGKTFNKSDGTHLISFESLDLIINDKNRYEFVADDSSTYQGKAHKFLSSALKLLGRNSVEGEFLHLFSEGVSKRDFIYHIQKFGVNNRGGTESYDKQITCRVNHYYTDKIGKNQPLSKSMLAKADYPIEVIFEPKYASFSPQLVAHYTKRLKEFLHTLWNGFIAETTQEFISEDQLGTQFLNWEVPVANKHKKDTSMNNNAYSSQSA